MTLLQSITAIGERVVDDFYEGNYPAEVTTHIKYAIERHTAELVSLLEKMAEDRELLRAIGRAIDDAGEEYRSANEGYMHGGEYFETTAKAALSTLLRGEE